MSQESLQRQSRRLRALVSGRVQGVNFRSYTLREASRLGLTGWVCNLPDGRVEVLAEGPIETLKRLAAFLQMGSPHAHVDTVDITLEEASGEFTSFTVHYTGS
jgi:acylphosphatase